MQRIIKILLAPPIQPNKILGSIVRTCENAKITYVSFPIFINMVEVFGTNFVIYLLIPPNIIVPKTAANKVRKTGDTLFQAISNGK